MPDLGSWPRSACPSRLNQPRALVFRRYTQRMADTTIKVPSAVRDRLAELARQRGCTIRELVAELTAATPTREELAARGAAATAYLREHVSPDLTDADADAGERFWRDLEAGRRPSVR